MTPASEAATARSGRRLSAYYGGQLGIKALYLVGLVLATRAVGPEGWGLLTALLAAGFILITGVNLGLNPYLSREVAAARLPQRSLFAAATRYRVLTSAAFALAFPLVAALTVGGVTRWSLLLILLFLLADSWAKYVFAALRGAENTRHEVIGGNLEKAIFAGVALLALLGTGSVFSAGLAVTVVAAGFALGAAVKLGVALVGARRSLAAPILPLRYLVATRARLRIWAREVRHLRGSADFLFMALFSTIYFRIDGYMLAALHGNLEAGFYGAAYRLIEGLLFAPEGVLVVFSPLLVRALARTTDPAASDGVGGGAAAGGDGEEARQTVGRVAALQVAISAPLVLGLMLEHRWIIETVYGAEFEAAGLILLWLGPAMACMALNFLLGGLLTASYLQRALLLISGVAAFVNVGLNAWLIPRHGAIGATVATVATEGLVGAAMAIRIAARVPIGWIVRPAGRVLGYFAVMVLLPTIAAAGHLEVMGRAAVGLTATGLFFVTLTWRREIPRLVSLMAREERA